MSYTLFDIYRNVEGGSGTIFIDYPRPNITVYTRPGQRAFYYRTFGDAAGAYIDEKPERARWSNRRMSEPEAYRAYSFAVRYLRTVLGHRIGAEVEGEDYVIVETAVPESLVRSIREEGAQIAGDDFAPPAVLDIQPGSELERYGIQAALHAGMGQDLRPLKYLGTYSTHGGYPVAVFGVEGQWPKKLVVMMGANNAVVGAWYVDGWTRALAVWNLSKYVPHAYPAKDRWGSIIWRQWREVAVPTMAAYRYVAGLGYRIAIAGVGGDPASARAAAGQESQPQMSPEVLWFSGERVASVLGYPASAGAAAGQDEPRQTDLDEPTHATYIDSFGDNFVPTQVANYPGPRLDIVAAGEVQPRRPSGGRLMIPSNCKIARLPNGVWVAKCRINTASGPVEFTARAPEAPIIAMFARRAARQGATSGAFPGAMALLPGVLVPAGAYAFARMSKRPAGAYDPDLLGLRRGAGLRYGATAGQVPGIDIGLIPGAGAPGYDIGGLFDSIKKVARKVARSRVVRSVGRGAKAVLRNPVVRTGIVAAAGVYGVPPAVTNSQLDAIQRLPDGMVGIGMATGTIGIMAGAKTVSDMARGRNPKALRAVAQLATGAKKGDANSRQGLAQVLAQRAVGEPSTQRTLVAAARRGHPVARQAVTTLRAARDVERYANLADRLVSARPAAPAPSGRAARMATQIAAGVRAENPRAKLAVRKLAIMARRGNPTAVRALQQIRVAARGGVAPPMAPPGRLAAPAGGRAQIVSATRLPSGQTRVVADVGGAGWDMFRRWLWNPSYRGEEQAMTLREGYRSGLDKMRAMARARQAEQTPLLPAGR